MEFFIGGSSCGMNADEAHFPIKPVPVPVDPAWKQPIGFLKVQTHLTSEHQTIRNSVPGNNCFLLPTDPYSRKQKAKR